MTLQKDTFKKTKKYACKQPTLEYNSLNSLKKGEWSILGKIWST